MAFLLSFTVFLVLSLSAKYVQKSRKKVLIEELCFQLITAVFLDIICYIPPAVNILITSACKNLIINRRLEGKDRLICTECVYMHYASMHATKSK